MGPILTDDIWMRRGLSLLWDAESLGAVCKPRQVISLRRFMCLGANGWQEADLDSCLVNGGRALVVAGVESAIDSLLPEQAVSWLEEQFTTCLMSFQNQVAGGGTEAALLLWLADSKRLEYHTSEDTHYWHCGTEHKGHKIPLSRCLFNGAQADRQLIRSSQKKSEAGIGLYLQRIS